MYTYRYEIRERRGEPHRGRRHIAEPRKSVCDLCLVIFWLFIHCYGRSLLGLPLYSVDCEERYSRKGVDRGFLVVIFNTYIELKSKKNLARENIRH